MLARLSLLTSGLFELRSLNVSARQVYKAAGVSTCQVEALESSGLIKIQQWGNMDCTVSSLASLIKAVVSDKDIGRRVVLWKAAPEAIV